MDFVAKCKDMSKEEQDAYVQKLTSENEVPKAFEFKAFDKIKELAKNFGYSSIRLTVNKNNKKTINAYLKYRFAIIDKAVTDIGNGFVMDDYIMSYTI